MTLLSAALMFTLFLQDTVRPLNLPPDEILLDHRNAEEDASELKEQLEWLTEHPLDLNSARREEFEAVPGVTSAEAAALIKFRALVKRFTSVDQLAAMEGHGDALLKKLGPFLTVGAPPGRLHGPTVEIRSRVSRSSTVADTLYLGSPEKFYTALTVTPSVHARLGGLYAKDAGERAGDGFVSGYVQVLDLGLLTQAIVGDFVMESGQGLVYWRGSAFGKGGEPTSSPRKIGQGPQPYRSTNEFSFFRGGALTVAADFAGGKLQGSCMYSSRALGATRSEDGSITSFYESGLFRDETELKKQNTVRERTMGGRVEYSTPGGDAFGVSYCRSVLDEPLVPRRLFQFEGTTGEVGSVDARLEFGSVGVFGEVARSRPGVFAYVAGSIVSFGAAGNCLVLFRFYPTGFASLHARSFGEHADGTNERGVYCAWNFCLTPRLVVSGFLDEFKFPWRTPLVPFPSAGSELQIRVAATVTSSLEIGYLFSMSTTEHSIQSIDRFGRAEKNIGERASERHRLTAVFQTTPRLRIRARVDRKAVNNGPGLMAEVGNLISAEFRYEYPRRFVLEAGLIYFDTDSYDSRMAEYEHDLRGVFSGPSLYGQGRRWYVLGEWTLTRWLQIAAKYAMTERFGSSPYQTSLQLSMKF